MACTRKCTLLALDLGREGERRVRSKNWVKEKVYGISFPAVFRTATLAHSQLSGCFHLTLEFEGCELFILMFHGDKDDDGVKPSNTEVLVQKADDDTRFARSNDY